MRRAPDPTDRRRVLVEPVPGLDVKLAALHASIARAQMDVDRPLRRRPAADPGRLPGPQHRGRAPGDGEDARAQRGSRSGRQLRGAAWRSHQRPSRLHFRRTQDHRPRRSPLSRSCTERDSTVRCRGCASATAWSRCATRASAGSTGAPRSPASHIDVSAHWRKDRGEIALNPSVPWAIELRGGVSRLSVDARALRLESFELRGGASQST